MSYLFEDDKGKLREIDYAEFKKTFGRPLSKKRTKRILESFKRQFYGAAPQKEIK